MVDLDPDLLLAEPTEWWLVTAVMSAMDMEGTVSNLAAGGGSSQCVQGRCVLSGLAVEDPRGGTAPRRSALYRCEESIHTVAHSVTII